MIRQKDKDIKTENDLQYIYLCFPIWENSYSEESESYYVNSR